MKTRFTLKLTAAALGAAGLLAALPAAHAQQKFITIGTGGVTGVYYAAGGAICRLVNKDRAKHGIRCSVESTGGSVFNINTIKAGELDMGVAQSDVHFNAVKGIGPVQEGRRVRRAARRDGAAPGAVHGAGAQGSEREELRRLQGQALQRRQSRLGHALLAGRADRRHGLEARRFLARLRAEGRRARPGALRRQDRRLLLRRRPPVGEHPGPDHGVRREARLRDRSGGRQAGEGEAVLRQGDDPRRAVSRTTRSRPRPTACSRRWCRPRRFPRTRSTPW